MIHSMRMAGISTLVMFAGLALASFGFVNPTPIESLDVSRTMPIHFFRSGDCTGEVVEISGTIHLVSQTLQDGSTIGHFNYQGVTGEGMTSGMVYQVTAVDHFYLKEPISSGVHSMRNFHLISRSGESNLLVTILYHLTVDANGELAADIETLDMKCTG